MSTASDHLSHPAASKTPGDVIQVASAEATLAGLDEEGVMFVGDTEGDYV